MTKRFRRAVGLIHWTSAANPKHGAPECGSTSFSYTDRVEVVTCPRCKARRAFRAAVAFLECLGCAAVAGEAAGPWVVRVTVRGSTRWHSRTGPAESFLNDASTYGARAEADAAAAEWGTDYATTVLPLAEAERMEAAGITVEGGGGKVEITDCTAEPAMVEGWNDAGGRSVLVRSGVVVASAEWGRPGNWAHWLFPDGRQGGVTTTLDEARAAAEAAFPPEPPKPAGWVIEDTAAVKYRWRGNGVRSGGGNWRPLVAEVVPFATESEAREAAKRLAHITVRVLPVDAAGNVIEAAGEEREWEAMRADRDAFKARAETLECERDSLREHLAAARTELAAIKAERDALNAAEADLRGALRAAAQAEQPCGCSASEVARLKAILECGSSPYGMHRCCHCDSEVT